MSYRSRFAYLPPSLFITTLLLALINSPAWAQRSRAADETLIKKQLADYAEARSGGNGQAQALFYTEDADEWGGRPQMSKGRAALERDLALPPIPGNRFKLEVLTLSFLTSDIALVDALYYYGPANALGEPLGHAFYLMVRLNAKWLIRSARITAW